MYETGNMLAYISRIRDSIFNVNNNFFINLLIIIRLCLVHGGKKIQQTMSIRILDLLPVLARSPIQQINWF